MVIAGLLAIAYFVSLVIRSRDKSAQNARVVVIVVTIMMVIMFCFYAYLLQMVMMRDNSVCQKE